MILHVVVIGREVVGGWRLGICETFYFHTIILFFLVTITVINQRLNREPNNLPDECNIL